VQNAVPATWHGFSFQDSDFTTRACKSQGSAQPTEAGTDDNDMVCTTFYLAHILSFIYFY
jgi:hypothetical protein